MSVIAQEAGTSRGAMQHHFPTREDLVFAALEHTFEQRMASLSQVQVPEGRRAEFVVQLVIDHNTDDLFKAALQMWAAAAADPELRERILPLERHFAREVHATVVRLLNADDSDPTTRALIQATLDLARGLGLADLLTDDSRRRAPIAQAWAAQLATVIREKD
jgi:AcrR family transcriptional regulator